MTLGGFCMTWLILLAKIIQAPSRHENVPNFVAFHIVSMATLATTCTLFFNWGGVCIDALG